MAVRLILAAALACMLTACGGNPAEETAAGETSAAESTITAAPLASINASAPDQPPANAPNTPPPPPADPLAVGSQDARDDLYCSAMIYVENPDVPNALAPIDEALLRKAQALGFAIGESGLNRLITEKAAHATHGRIIADAYMARVERDVAAKKPRISLDDCNKRAAALPMIQ